MLMIFLKKWFVKSEIVIEFLTLPVIFVTHKIKLNDVICTDHRTF